MTLSPLTCSRCLHVLGADQRPQFCPRCGAAFEPVSDQGIAIKIPIAGGSVKVRDRLALGDLCNLYRCDVAGPRRRGVFKIARSALGNRHVLREAETLRGLHAADSNARFAPFLPRLVDSISYAHEKSEPSRQANVLVYFDGIDGPDDLYSLEQVRAAYPNGIDPRDMAWMWRRLLTILAFVHSQNLAHGMLTPDHILIEPREHKLVVIGWSAAAPFGMLPHLTPWRWSNLLKTSAGEKPVPASAQTDLGAAAGSMSYLLADPLEPAIARHLERAVESSDALRLLDDFDKMIEALWGPRQFRTFAMPPRS